MSEKIGGKYGRRHEERRGLVAWTADIEPRVADDEIAVCGKDWGSSCIEWVDGICLVTVRVGWGYFGVQVPSYRRFLVRRRFQCTSYSEISLK